ncbi:hypothetical protein GCM10010270_83260 [Streptomyces violaceus]|nr:hypothetical protein GCM10010270_83260 [Streptomyces janthinus]
MIIRKKILGAAAALFMTTTALIAGTVAVATPAHATVNDCRQYLKDRGYRVGEKVTGACRVGRSEGKAHPICNDVLWRLGVRARHADIACDLANA